MTTLEVPDKAAELLRQSAELETSKGILLLAEAAHLIVPSPDLDIYDVDEALVKGRGNCFVHSQIVGELALLTVDFVPLIDILLTRNDGHTHVNCLVYDKRTMSGIVVNNADVIYYPAEHDDPCTTALDLLKGGDELVAVYGAHKDDADRQSRDWFTEVLAEVDQKPSGLPEDVKIYADRIILPFEQGLRTMGHIKRVVELVKNGDSEQLYEYITENANELPGFSIVPKKQPKPKTYV